MEINTEIKYRKHLSRWIADKKWKMTMNIVVVIEEKKNIQNK